MRKPFKPSIPAETQFARSLKRVARVAGHIVGIHIDGTKIIDEPEMMRALREYSKLITPWAKRQSAKMLEQVQKSNKRSYNSKSVQMNEIMKREVASGHIGEMAYRLMNEQVELIKSIPLRAGERAQKLSIEAAFNGERASEIAEALKNSTEVSESDAVRIARTEVARSNTYITQARSQAVGSRQYIWRNSGDAAVRDAHKIYHGHKLDGMIFSWDSPPTLDDGTTGHPGTFPNCRCYPEPVFDSE